MAPMRRSLSPCPVRAGIQASVHRWYLLMMLMVKLVLHAFRVLRVPPLLQCVLVTVAGFTMPRVLGSDAVAALGAE